MVYLANVILPSKGNLISSLRAVYGIGLTRAHKMVSMLGLKPNAKITDINQTSLNVLGGMIEDSFIVDSELKRRVSLCIKHLKDIKSFRGYRHFLGLPTRGQRTHTNASTHRKISKINLTGKLFKSTAFSSKVVNDLNKKKVKTKSKSNIKNKSKKKKIIF